VIVTVVTTVEPTVTVSADEDAASTSTTTDATATAENISITTSSSSTDNGIVTATAVVTATFTAPAAAPTGLEPFSLVQVFPACSNDTDTIAALAAVTIPDLVLPSNLTLSQMLGFFGGQANCTDVLQFLGFGSSDIGGSSASNSTNLVRRNFMRGKRSGLR